MTLSQMLTGYVAVALEPILRRAVFPETTYLVNGNDIPPHRRNLARHLGHESKKPLAPRERLSARLSMLVALKEYEKQLVLDIIRDTEAVEDAKLHKEVGL